MKANHFLSYFPSINHFWKTIFITLILLINLSVGLFAVPTHLKIFLIGGQSNAAGAGLNTDLAPEYQGVQTKVKSYTSFLCSDAVNADKWLHVAPGVCDLAANHGCELSLAKKLGLLYPNDSIAIIKCALGGSVMATMWRSPSLGGATSTEPNRNLYQIFMNTVNTALGKLGVDYTYEIAGMVWMQGESDGTKTEWADMYETNLTAFITDLRKDLNTPDMPFVIGKITVSAFWTYATTIRQAEDNVSAKLTKVRTIDANLFPRYSFDAAHYSSAGLIAMGDEFALSLNSIILQLPFFTIKSAGDVTSLNGTNNTLQMSVNVNPATASNNVTWDVDDPEIASIDAAGLLTAHINGPVLITATAKDGSGVKSSQSINITGASQQNNWEFKNTLQNWGFGNLANSCDVSNVAGSMVIRIRGSDPYVYSPNIIPDWQPGNAKYLWLRVKNETSDVGGQFFVFMSTASGGGFLKYDFVLTPNDTQFRDIYINLQSNASWISNLNIINFRIDPIIGTNSQKGSVTIDFMRFLNTIPDPTAITVKSLGNGTIINGIGSTLQMTADVLPVIANKDVIWSVDNGALATISPSGLLTSKAVGDVTITATSMSNPSVKGSLVISIISQVVLVNGITVNSAGAEIKGLNNTLQISALITPATATNKNVTYSVDKPEIAKIDAVTGVLTSVSAGIVIVTATSQDGTNISGNRTITVYTGQKNAWEFTYDLEGWEHSNSSKVTVVSGAMAFDISGADSYIYSPIFNPAWSANGLNTAWISVKNTTSDTKGQFYMLLDAASGGTYELFNFDLTPNDTQFRDIYIDLTKNPKWNNNLKITNFRIDPVAFATSGKVYVDFLRIINNGSSIVNNNLESNIKVFQSNSGLVIDLAGLIGNQQITIVNILGKQLISKQSIGGEKLVISNLLKSGIYFIKVQGNNKTQLMKVIIR